MPGGAAADEEKYDPAAAIWAKQKAKEAQAAAKKHEAKHTELDQARKQVHVQETKSASTTWKEAEAELNRALKAKNPKSGPDPDADNKLRKHGAAVSHRRDRSKMSLSPVRDPQTSQRTARKQAEDSFLAPTDSMHDEWDDMLFDSRDDSMFDPGSPSSRCTSRTSCFDTRKEFFRLKAKTSADRLADHARRRLRTKVADVLIEVKRRQELYLSQEKARKFREQKQALGRGPKASLGDTSEFSFGITCLSESSNIKEMTSPRRTALLDSLSLEELDLMRERPEFFFTGNPIAGAVKDEQQVDDRMKSFGGSSGSFSSTAPPAKKLFKEPVDAEVFEELIEFFSVPSTEKEVDVRIYRKKLRESLLAGAGPHNTLTGGTASAEINWREKLCRRIASDDPKPPEEEPQVEENIPSGPLEMMPCLGRHPTVRADQASPTLEKVRVVYERRDQQDAQWMDDRRDAIERRSALNSFKAREQQRELQLQEFKQKELHKVRMLQAGEKKAALVAEEIEKTEVMGIQKIHKLRAANERADRFIEDRRDQAAVDLEAWHAGVMRSFHLVKQKDHEKRKAGERQHEKYMARLESVGESRAATRENRSQGQLNDELKGKIQTSLVAQIQEQEIQKSLERGQALKVRLEAADFRRRIHQTGNRYGLCEKAFGANSSGFDAKSHSIAVDRRKSSWRKTAEAWHKMEHSFSAPSMGPSSPLSPGGTLNEEDFNSLKSTASFKKIASATSPSSFKMSASAMALA